LQPQVIGDIGSPNNVLTLSDDDCDVFSALRSDDSNRKPPVPPTTDLNASPARSVYFCVVDK